MEHRTATENASMISENSDRNTRKKKSNKKQYQAVRSDKLSSWGNPRYVIVDTATGQVMDDAQGYGYKSASNAYAAWGYKNRSAEKKSKDHKICAWLAKNKKFTNYLEDCAWYAVKDGSELPHLSGCGAPVR